MHLEYRVHYLPKACDSLMEWSAIVRSPFKDASATLALNVDE